MSNEVDQDRLDSKTLNASVINLDEYREQAKMRSGATLVNGAVLAGGISTFWIIVAVVLILWLYRR